MSDDFKWFRSRVLAGTLRMLDDDDQGRFDGLLESDAACSELHERITQRHADEVASAPGHIPPEIIARWDDAVKRLRGLERAAVRRHLQRCEACRAALLRVDFEPVLPRDEALELDAGSVELFFPDAKA